MAEQHVKPIDDLTPEELRLEYLRLAGWTDVEWKFNTADYSAELVGITPGYVFQSIPSYLYEYHISCPDPTTSIADAMEALDGFEWYIDKTVYKDRGVEYEIYLHATESEIRDSSLTVAITRAVVAAKMEVQDDV